MSKKTVKNKRLRSSVTVIEERPNLEKFGKAGIRLKIDEMLMLHHGISPDELAKLTGEERQVLRLIASEEDPVWGVTHQADALEALGLLHDTESLLMLSEMARAQRADLRLRVSACYALGEIADPQVRPVLQSLLQDKVSEIRAQAVKAMLKMGNSADLLVLEQVAERDQTFVGQIANKAVSALRTRLGLSQER